MKSSYEVFKELTALRGEAVQPPHDKLVQYICEVIDLQLAEKENLRCSYGGHFMSCSVGVPSYIRCNNETCPICYPPGKNKS